MAARMLDGAAVAQRDSRRGRRRRSRRSPRAPGRPPGLGIVLVGDDPASEIYVRNKLKSAGEAGLRADLERLPATRVARRAARGGRPAESQRRARRHPRAVAAAGGDGRGRRAARVRRRSGRTRTSTAFIRSTSAGWCRTAPTLVACTPSGVIELLERSNMPIAGARAVVIGRSDIVGKPMALLLLHRHATVTICHSRTADLPRGRRARPTFSSPRSAGRRSSRRTFVKPGATVVDVGTTRVDRPRGRRAAVSAGLEAARRVRAPRLARRRRRASGRGGGRRRADAGARRRRSADDRDAAEEHARCGAERQAAGQRAAAASA